MTKTPVIHASEAALRQILLIGQNDYTLIDMSFRIKIGGKGCAGFTYEAGFTPKLADDLVLSLPYGDSEVQIIMDAFTAHYSPEIRLDYALENGVEGFVIQSLDDGQFAGKFFSKPDFIPPELT